MKEQRGCLYKVVFYKCRSLVEGVNGKLCIPSKKSSNYKKVLGYFVEVHKVAIGNKIRRFQQTVLDEGKGVFFTKISEENVRLTSEEAGNDYYIAARGKAANLFTGDGRVKSQLLKATIGLGNYKKEK